MKSSHEPKAELTEESTTCDIKGYVLDPTSRTINPHYYSGCYKEITKVLECSLFDVARFNETLDVAFIDDEGLLKNPTHFFAIRGYHSPLAGKGWVLGTDGKGETVSPTVNLKWLRDNVMFYEIVGNFSTKVLAEVVPANDLGKAMLVDIHEEDPERIEKRFIDFEEMRDSNKKEITDEETHSD